MKLATSFGLVACLLLAAPAICAPPSQTTPRGSFLSHPAKSVVELVRQVNADSAARLRYANFYGLNADGVPVYLGKLKLIRLTSGQTLKSWYVDSDGSVRPETRVLAKGSLVFADSDGSPMLTCPNGNPIGSGGILSAAQGNGDTGAVQGKVLAQVEEIGKQPAAAVPALASTINPETAAATATQEPVQTASAAQPSSVDAIQPASSGGGKSGLAILGGLAGLLGGLAAAGAGGGGAGKGIPTVIIPEPSSLASLISLGALALLGLRKRRR